jgi:MSHA biogenesis protein MshM
VDFYVAHRLRVAGFDGGRLFSRGGVSKLYKASGGIPRLINIMAHKALMVAYGEGRQQVSGRHVALAASDTLASKPRRFWQRPWPWLAGTGVLAAACGVSWTLLNR